MQYNFDWDPEKAKINIKKHKVSFEHATTIFKDPNTLTVYDPDHSEIEDRWITLGIASNGMPIVVHHTFEYLNVNNAIIRIFSSRKATKVEIKHIAATPIGMEVVARSELQEIDELKLKFKVEAYDEKEKIGEGTHTRYIIYWDDFIKKVENKKNS